MIGMGFTNDWHALAACRVILGLFEAGFFPVSALPETQLPRSKNTERWWCNTCFRFY
jgi:hypothetical protein